MFLIGVLISVIAFAGCSKMDHMELSTTLKNAAKKEGSFTVNITTPGDDWTAKANQSWLTISPTSGKGDATLTITYQENTISKGRIGSIELVDSYGMISGIAIVQQGDSTLTNAFLGKWKTTNDAYLSEITFNSDMSYSAKTSNDTEDADYYGFTEEFFVIHNGHWQTEYTYTVNGNELKLTEIETGTEEIYSKQ